MLKRNEVTYEVDGLEAAARFRKQDDEFCQRMRMAVEAGRESCPTTVSTEPCTKRPILNYVRPD